MMENVPGPSTTSEPTVIVPKPLNNSSITQVFNAHIYFYYYIPSGTLNRFIMDNIYICVTIITGTFGYSSFIAMYHFGRHFRIYWCIDVGFTFNVQKCIVVW